MNVGEVFYKDTTIRDITSKNYLNQLCIIYNLITGEKISSVNKISGEKLANLLIDNKILLKTIFSNKYKSSSIRTKVVTIKAFLTRVLPEKSPKLKVYNTWFKELTIDLENKQSAGMKSATEKKQWTTMDDLIKIRNNMDKKITSEKLWSNNKLKKTQFDLLRDMIIISIHTLLENPRRNIWRTINILDIETFNKFKKTSVLKDNYLIYNADPMYLYLTKQKNGKIQEIQLRSINNTNIVENLILKYISKFNIKTNTFLFTNYKKLPISQVNYTRILKRHLGVGSSMIRKIYKTENTNIDDINVYNKLKNQAIGMGHSISTGFNYYVKNDL
tara:strand:+ start:38 stop:1030 length:993 start_codon:yes stop_codon:yes gene_type:complete